MWISTQFVAAGKATSRRPGKRLGAVDPRVNCYLGIVTPRIYKLEYYRWLLFYVT
jgi:hypothetical protein